jgi:hypothetical protein
MNEWRRKRRIPENKPSTLIAKSYTVPIAAAEEIKEAASLYGSQGRVLLAATEILIRLDKLPPPESEQPTSRVTFRLQARTIQLIDSLSKQNYNNNVAQVFAACVRILKMKKIKI